MIFSGFTLFRDTQSMDPKTPFPALGVLWYEMLGPPAHAFYQRPCEGGRRADRMVHCGWSPLRVRARGRHGGRYGLRRRRWCMGGAQGMDRCMGRGKLWARGICVGLGAPSQNPIDFSWYCAVLRYPSYGPKNTGPGPWCVEVWVVGAPPQNSIDIFRHCALHRHLSQGSSNTVFYGL